ncbi:golgin subfamily A member 2-like isoform X1 [Mytilus edulis]|uniref:golgin subfamily A member 2-like isoform X1 n=1 Tax=Mytilus edulis TaxID=6550 RepID=UPI0039F0A6D1
MADTAKREKIAAARKKLNQFKKKTGKTSPANAKKSKINDESTQNPENEIKHTAENTFQNLNGNSATDIIQTKDSPDSIENRKDSEDLNKMKTHPNLSPGRTTASTESLHQLSRQLNGLLAESSALIGAEDLDTSSVEELERRNQDLAALLEKHSQANEQLNLQIQQIRDHSKNLQGQLERERENFLTKQKQELGPLKEQLQVHIQTIGILVAEKTETQSQLNQSQKLAETRFNEIEELSGRLKASRQRVADLERSLSTTSSSSQQFQKSSKDYAKDVDRLKLDLYKANKSNEELQQQTSELSGKLQAKVTECTGLEQSIDELKNKLEMAELYSKQVSSHQDGGQESLKIVETLKQEKEELLTKIHEYTEAFQRVSTEKDQLSEQYQQYMDQLQGHNKKLTEQITSLTEDRENLLTSQHDLESSILELQRRLEDVDSNNTSANNDLILQKDNEMHQLREKHEDFIQKYEGQMRDNVQLSRLLEEKEDKITQLEDRMSEVNREDGDKAHLLESIQSNKTALSRALTQNKELKHQLAELQNGFVKMSNENMELMTRIQSEQHSSKELFCKLTQQEDELRVMRDALSVKQSKLTDLELSTHEAKKDMYQQEQLHDRLRHYEAQAQLVESLGRELHNSQDMVEALKTQNSELRTMLIKATSHKENGHTDSEEEKKRDDVIDSLSSAIQQLEIERNQLVESLKEQRELSDSLSIKVSDLQEEVVQKSAFQSEDNNIVSRVEYEQLKQAMELIQNKYMKVMRDKAELSDKSDELEHTVLQLQGESETIGEYISLYHHQRAILQQRELQKNDYISHLAKDREEMSLKLGELQTLMMQLLGEKNMLHNYHEESSITSPDVSIQPHLSQEPMVNGTDWPDYTSSEEDSDSEVETIVGGQEGTTDTLGEETPQDHTNHNHHHHNHDHHNHEHHHHMTKDQRPDKSKTNENTEGTATKIMNLLSEISHNNYTDRTVDHNFLPCKYCKGKVYNV